MRQRCLSPLAYPWLMRLVFCFRKVVEAVLLLLYSCFSGLRGGFFFLFINIYAFVSVRTFILFVISLVPSFL